MAHIVERLETTLSAWEDYWYLISVLNRCRRHNGLSPICTNEGAVVNGGKLRKTILGFVPGRGPTPDMMQFVAPPQSDNITGFLHDLGPHIASWCWQSRRVFHLTAELQAILDATSLDEVRWRHVSLPFVTFAISLAKPLMDTAGCLFDFILVSTYMVANENATAVQLRFFSKQCDSYKPLSQANRQNLENRIRSRDWRQVEKTALRLFARIDQIVGSHINLSHDDADVFVTDTANKIAAIIGENNDLVTCDPRPIWNALVRIVVGMCLYLDTLPPQSPHISDWSPAPHSGLQDRIAITRESEICTVSSCYKLTAEEIDLLSRPESERDRLAYELRCHWRRGHWRRPPGKGSDPAAAKTVHVRPALVRLDRLGEKQLPGGTETVL